MSHMYMCLDLHVVVQGGEESYDALS